MSDTKKCEPILFGDPGKLFYLVNSLYDRSVIILQKKINRYLQEVSLCMLAFIVQEIRTTPKSIVRVIGEYELRRPVIMEPDCWFLQFVKEQDGAVVEEDDLDGLLKVELNHLLNTKFFVPFENCYMLPIYHPLSKKLCLYVGFVNYPREFEYEKILRGIAEGCFRHCLPTLKNAMALEEEKLHRKMGEQMFKSVVSLIVDLENELLLYKGIKREALKIFEAEDCMVHVMDENLAQKVIDMYTTNQRSRKGEPKMDINEIYLPKNCTITNLVAKKGQIINCKHTPRDPYAHPDIIRVEDGVWILRNSLTFPIIMCERIKGVIKVLNKITAPHFTVYDEQNANGFGLACGLVMESARHYRRVEEKFFYRQMIDCMLSRISKFQECNQTHYKVPEKVPMIENLLKLKFNPYDIIGQDLVPYVMLIFYKLNILPRFKIDEDIFGSFVCGVFKSIPNLPFHNELHSFNAFHFIVLLTSYTNIQNYCKLTLTELLMLLIAALAQDMDWKGSTTSFQFIRGTSLAALYTSPGMVEKRLVISQLIRLLTMEEYNIFKFMSSEHYKLCLELLYDMVIATDVTHHVLKKPAISKMIYYGFKNDNIEHRKLLHGLIMNIAQFSIFTKSWETYEEASNRIVQEFFRHGNLSYIQKGLDYGQVDPIPERVASMHIEFIDNYCLPAFDLLENIVPLVKECSIRLIKYRNNWVIIRDESMSKRLKELEEELDKMEKDKASESSSSDEDEEEEDATNR